jgi:hypothetical protein
MMKSDFIIACGSITLPPWLEALILLVLAAWGISLLLNLVNFGLLVSETGKMSGKFAVINFGLWILYVFLEILLFSGGLSQDFNVLFIAVPAIPILIISHFCYLFVRWRKEYKKYKIQD